MSVVVWRDELDTGIDVIDGQHRRIVEMINQLELARHGHSREAVSEVLDELVDYTLSHFAFEEALMEDAGYAFCAAHRRVHELFARRVQEYRLRFQAGEDMLDELRAMLVRWLFNHIRSDDKAYSPTVKQHLNGFASTHENGGWLRRTLLRFFR
ncbi:bacteriohemerythrin [Luteimonas sp. S4-F44]|uniref:bacteriohemerythrin n=1 Tax=Luteimonas sp. S4-F44 TaxID=2925842 RepID=UPI001F537034|nr:bacteriohemerythrin [Luteimonas sp. S4-F44]UNK42349.1 bacteriohemerythrin [Luteimonas sp. S4-F44]